MWVSVTTLPRRKPGSFENLGNWLGSDSAVSLEKELEFWEQPEVIWSTVY
jgi:hypothetical protein